MPIFDLDGEFDDEDEDEDDLEDDELDEDEEDGEEPPETWQVRGGPLGLAKARASLDFRF